MFPPRFIFFALSVLLLCGRFVFAQAVVNSTYTGQCQDLYSDVAAKTVGPPNGPRAFDAREISERVISEFIGDLGERPSQSE